MTARAGNPVRRFGGKGEKDSRGRSPPERTTSTEGTVRIGHESRRAPIPTKEREQIREVTGHSGGPRAFNPKPRRSREKGRGFYRDTPKTTTHNTPLPQNVRSANSSFPSHYVRTTYFIPSDSSDVGTASHQPDRTDDLRAEWA